ncbi:MAG: hypothetical protein J5764_02235, partial [Bacteroidales bacterium]|nr:hypothetical protein [Bacteroidales bacterium]
MKKHTRVLTIIFGILLLLAAAGFMVLQLPSVQTGIANYATEKLKEITDADISISKIQIKPLSAIVLRDVCILDTNPYIPDENSLRQYDPVDTLFSASAVSARIDISSLLTMEPIKFGNATVDNGHLHLTVEPDSVYGVNLTRIFRIPKSNEELSQKDIFLIRTINVNNFRFSLTSFAPFGPMRSLEPQEINWENFSVRTNVEGRDLHFSDGRMSGVAEKVELWQDKGFHCRQVEGQALVGRGKAIITDIYAVEDNSTVHLDTLTFSYRDASDFSDFINKVHIRGRASETRPSLFAMKTLRFFAPGFSANRCVANVKSLIVDGYVSDLHVTNFNVRDTLSGISALIEASCTKLPEIGNNDVEASIRNMSFTPERLEKFISGFTGYHPGLDKTLPRGFYTLNSHTSGNLNNLRENAAINSTLGKVNVTSSVRNTANGKPLEVQALLNARALDLGAIFKSAALGRCDIDALGMNLTTGRDIFNLRIDSLQIASLRFLQHDFKNLYASGSMDGENISATMTAGDSALLMNLEAESTAGNGSGPDKYKVHGKVYDADLHAFGVNVHKGESRIAFGIDGAMSILKEGSRHNGRLYLSNVELKDSAKVYQLGGIQTGYISYGEEKHIDMDSGFLEAHLSTDRSFNQLVPDFSEMTLAQAFPSVFSENIREQEDFGYCDLSVKTGYTREILDFLFPSMFIEKGTSLSVVSDTDGSMDAEFSSGRIIVGGIHGKGLYMDLNNKSGALSANMVSDELKLAGISLKDTRLNAEAADDNFDLNLFLSQLDHEENNIRAVVEGSLSKDENGKLELNASPLNSSITLAGEEWRFSDAPIRWNSDGIHIDQLTMDCNQQHIRMNGGVSRNVTDTLTIFMQNFDLTTVDQLTNGVYGLDGTVSADVIYISPLASDNTKLTLGVLCEDLTIDGVNAGTVLVDSRWDDRRNKMEFTLQNSIEHFQAINAHGDYRPSDRYVNASLELDSLNVAIAGPFFKNVFSEMGGSLSGTVEASGPLNKIKISSKGTRFNDTMLRIAYTGVPYHFNGPFEINQKGIVC